MSLLKEISITELSNLRIGHTSDHDAKTGVTVLYFPNGAKAGCDISGGGPASRETPLTSPVTADNPINAIVLSGGSAYGLAAADGVMNYLESQNIGYNTGAALVPLVCQSCIYDLSYGDLKYVQLQKWAKKPAVRHLQEQIPEPEISVQVPVQLWENFTV